ncbi:ATP-binding protein, partial [Vibrio owensii]
VEAISLKQMVNEVVESADARLSAKSVIANIQIDDHLSVLGDAFLLKQAVFNLMDNALDFVDSEGRIEWKTEVTKEKVCLSIFNSGPHIPDYAMPRLTERFYSLARENGVKSTGLGLNFVEQVTKLHKGKLQVENVDSGVKVTLILPTP